MYLFCGFLGKNTCRCTHHNKQSISTRGLTSETPIAIAFLMPRVEKSTWYIFKKESCSCDTPSCVSCKYSEIKNLKFQYQATRNFFLCYIRCLDREVTGRTRISPNANYSRARIFIQHFIPHFFFIQHFIPHFFLFSI